jgi:RNA polymerase sigma factor (sigma-70 family)
VIQKVLLRLFRYLRNYKRSNGRFRDWLRTVVRNVTSDHRKKAERDRVATQSIDAVADPPDPTSLQEQLDKQFQREILTEARERVRARCKERDWSLFCRLTDDAWTSADAAREYGLTVETSYKIKSALVKQVRQEVARLDEEGFDGS